MKRILKAFFFALYSMIVSYLLVTGIDFGSEFTKNFLIFTTGLFLLNLMEKKLLEIISLPSEGFWFLVLSVLLNTALFFVMVTFIPEITISGTTDLNLNFGLDMLPSYELKSVPTLALSASVFTLFYRFLYWISGGRR